ncbi:aliphatic nitrilase [Colletotrichum incanum]|uniref:Aliphatic nitrilase n=1 Tax=Colletotrichum incanum TaxID=1573173 RepID=A0A161WAC8_COLIC|nr:aliphatic nitrilase [Colletotrichum incanum]
MPNPIRIAACHVSSVLLSARGTIPAFPIWSAVRPPTEHHDLFKRMALDSVYVDGEEVSAIIFTAKKLNMMVSLGICEKLWYSSATLFNSNVIIGSDGDILVHHRKLMPTFFEKLTSSLGDGYGLRVAETRFGKISNLICGENTNLLARYALVSQGEQIHISTGSSVANSANYDNLAPSRARAAAHCFEAKCLESSAQGSLARMPMRQCQTALLRRALKNSQRGATLFLNPSGRLLPGFTIDSATSERKPAGYLQSVEGILYADLDVGDCIEGKWYHNIVGDYQRLDVFDLKIDRRRRSSATFTGDILTVGPAGTSTSEE